MYITNLYINAVCQDCKALWSTLLPLLIHKCHCLIVQLAPAICYLKINYIHGALQSGYATMCNAQCNNSEDNLFLIRCIQSIRSGWCQQNPDLIKNKTQNRLILWLGFRILSMTDTRFTRPAHTRIPKFCTPSTQTSKCTRGQLSCKMDLRKIPITLGKAHELCLY